MTTYGKLTKKNNGSFALPLVEEYNRPKDVRVDDVIYGKVIWRLWSNPQLNKKGLTKIEDVTPVPAGQERTAAFTDAFNGGIVERTFTLTDTLPAGLKQQLLGRVNGKREAISQAGIVVTVRGSDHVLQTDEGSQKLLIGALAATNASHPLPAGFSWRMRDNTDVALNPAEMKSVSGAVFDHVNAAHGAALIHKATIEALTTWAELDAYDLEAGWPPVAPEVTP